MKLIAIYDSLFEKSLLVCVISDKNPVQPNIFSSIYSFTVVFGLFCCTVSTG